MARYFGLGVASTCMEWDASRMPAAGLDLWNFSLLVIALVVSRLLKGPKINYCRFMSNMTSVAAAQHCRYSSKGAIGN